MASDHVLSVYPSSIHIHDGSSLEIRDDDHQTQEVVKFSNQCRWNRSAHGFFFYS